MRNILIVIFLILGSVLFSQAQEKVDNEITSRFRDEGFNHSQVMEPASMMSDVYGPRLSNSPSYNESVKWAVKKFKEYGISAKMEAYGETGIGWTNKYTSAHMHESQYMTLTAYPEPYARGTDGKVVSNVIHINTAEIASRDDLEQYKGKLKGRIICITPKRDIELDFVNPQAVRLSDEELNDMAELHINRPEEKRRSRYEEDGAEISREEISEFFEKEGAAVLVRPGRPLGSAGGDKGVVVVNNSRPIFEEWMKPFHDVGMTHLVPGNTGGSDHMQFVRVGLPGFQFIQDDLEFFTTTFHTNQDFYDRLVAEDLMQASVILASFAYNAAMRDDKLPRTENQKENNRRWHK